MTTTVTNKEVAAAPAIVEKGEEEEHPLQTGWSLWCAVLPFRELLAGADN